MFYGIFANRTVKSIKFGPFKVVNWELASNRTIELFDYQIAFPTHSQHIWNSCFDPLKVGNNEEDGFMMQQL